MSETISPEGSPSPGEGGQLDEAKILRLKRMMGLMSGILVLSFMIVVAAFVWRLSGGSTSDEPRRATHPAGYFGASRVALAPGETVRSVTLGEGRMAIHVASKDAESVILVDVKSGAELGRVLLTPVSDFAAR